jgi:chemotaxis protein MotB
MNYRITGPTLLLLFLVSATSCVTRKKYMETETARVNCEQENIVLKSQNIALLSKTNELKSLIDMVQMQNRQLASDSSASGIRYRELKDKFDRLSRSYDDLNQLMQQNTKNSSAEMQKLLAELQKAQGDLQIKEDKVRRAESELQAKAGKIDSISRDLADKQQRLKELQAILDRKDSAVTALKNKVMEALTGFVGKGLSIEQKNGKVYVHMDEKLLFATGSFEVASNGVEALKNLARVLEANPDINITVEGHTDNVAYKTGSTPINDNWDLSVMRATAVVKILLKNSDVSPARITAAGRSQFQPVDAANTPEARSKNRRTEIILTPKLDELLKILDNN